MSEPLVQYAIYEHPADHPDGYVLRRWLVGEDGAQPGSMRVFDTIEQARAALPEGVERFPVPDSDPTIVEVWF